MIDVKIVYEKLLPRVRELAQGNTNE